MPQSTFLSFLLSYWDTFNLPGNRLYSGMKDTWIFSTAFRTLSGNCWETFGVIVSKSLKKLMKIVPWIPLRGVVADNYRILSYSSPQPFHPVSVSFPQHQPASNSTLDWWTIKKTVAISLAEKEGFSQLRNTTLGAYDVQTTMNHPDVQSQKVNLKLIHPRIHPDTRKSNKM